MRGPIRWWRDRRDPTSGLEPFEFPSVEPLEENTELRDYLEDVAAADARGGLEEVFAMIEKRHTRQRDDIRFGREGRQLQIAIAALVVSLLAVIVAVVAIIIAQ